MLGSPCRQVPDDLTGLLLRLHQIELRLEVEPELWIGPEPVPEAQVSIARD